MSADGPLRRHQRRVTRLVRRRIVLERGLGGRVIEGQATRWRRWTTAVSNRHDKGRGQPTLQARLDHVQRVADQRRQHARREARHQLDPRIVEVGHRLGGGAAGAGAALGRTCPPVDFSPFLEMADTLHHAVLCRTHESIQRVTKEILKARDVSAETDGTY